MSRSTDQEKIRILHALIIDLHLKVIKMLLVFLYYALPILLEPYPISSSGHVALLQQILSKINGIMVPEIPSYYEYLLHGPIALVVLVFFGRSWLQIVTTSSMSQIKTMFFAGFMADLLTVLVYGFFSVVGMSIFPLWLGFFVTACLLFSLLLCKIEIIEQPFTMRSGAVLGIAQGIALLPGISRFGTTFVVARWLGYSEQKACIFSFLIEWPISIAGFFKGAVTMYQMQGDHSEVLNLSIGLVILIAMFGAYGGFYIIKQIIKQKKIWLFGYYVLFLSILSLMLNFF